MGYHRAGFDVVGVDIKPQPRYPSEFIQADALEYVAAHGREFDVIHASPPCQVYSVTAVLSNGNHPDLIEPVRELLAASGRPYVIENVPGAPLVNPLILCGSMFGLPLIRHRLFECNPVIWWPPAPHACGHLYTASSGGYSSFANGATAISMAGNNFAAEDGRRASGIDWMTRAELAQAIPPAYTEFIGRYLLRAVGEYAT
jgi:DNA (cytosine-5)-methyltransferase 1